MASKRKKSNGRPFRGGPPTGGGGGLPAGPGTVVTVSYELFDEEGERVEASEPGGSVAFLLGYGQVPPPFEQAIEGAWPGQARRVHLSPEHGFGRRDPRAVIEVDRGEFPGEVALGDQLEAEATDSGATVHLKVLEVRDEVVVVDANHPLADQKVRLEVVVESVRAATAQELGDATTRLLVSNARPEPTLLPAERLLRRANGRYEDPAGGTASVDATAPAAIAEPTE